MVLYAQEVVTLELVLISYNDCVACCVQSAHMAVIEAMMVLYAKEVVTPDGAVAAVQRFTQSLRPEPLPLDHEDAMLLWINKACSALKKKIEQELVTLEEQGGVILFI